MNPNTHLYLYAKGWYEKGNTIEDVRKIVAARSGLDRVSTRDALEVLLDITWLHIVGSGNPQLNFKRVIEDTVLTTSPPLDNAFDACLKVLCMVETTNLDLGAVDGSILPLRRT